MHTTFVFIPHLIITVGMPGSAITPRKKKATESGKKKNQIFCVLENDDGARILSSVSVKTAMSHFKANAGSLIHFAHSMQAAETLQRVIENRYSIALNGAYCHIIVC